MNQLRIEAYMNELATMLETHQQQAKQQAGVKAQLAMLDDAGQQEQAMQAANQLEAVTAIVSSVELSIAKKSKRQDIESARTLYMDIATRMQSADKLFEDWRRIEAQYELAVSTGQLKDEDREKAQAALTAAKHRFEKQVELGAALVPVQSDLLVTSSGLLGA